MRNKNSFAKTRFVNRISEKKRQVFLNWLADFALAPYARKAASKRAINKASKRIKISIGDVFSIC